MSRPSQARSRVVELILMALLTASGALPAFALEVHRFDIPEEEAATAIRAFGEQAHVQILVAGEAVKGKRLHAVTGQLSTEDGLNALLSGSGLTHQYVGDHSIALLAAQVTAASTQAQGGAGSDPHEGKSNSSGNFLLAQATLGQTSGDVSVEKQDEQAAKKKPVLLEEVIVTGSRIPQTTKQGAQPVRIYTKEDIEGSGQTTVANFLNSLPDVAISTTSESAFSLQGVSQSSVQLHGLPIGTTLILLDGRRVETSVFGFLDLNNIPASAVERIEVLPVGSSAVYGADALGGAINIVLRKDLNGFEANAKYGHADGAGEADGNLGWGRSWSRGSVSVVGTYQDRSELSGRQRAITADANYSRYGGSDARTAVCNPGNVYSLNGQNLPGLSSQVAGIPSGIIGTPTIQDFTATAGQLNKCSRYDDYSLIAPTHREGALASADYRLADSMDLFSEVLYSHETLNVREGDLVRATNGPNGTLSANNPYNPFGVDVGINYTYPGIAKGYGGSQTAIRPLIGLRGSLSSDWNYEVTTFLSQDRYHYVLNGANSAALRTALASSNAATALNPFTSGAPGSAGLLESFGTVFFNFALFNREITSQGLLSGTLLTLPSGPLKAVFGTEYDRNTLESSSTFSSIEASRHTYSFFTEERIPLLAGYQDAVNGDKLAVSLAGRYDRSDDYGGKTTAQGGVEWRPGAAILIRGAYAMSYQAPQLQQLNGATVNFDETGLTDPFRGNESITVPATSGPNPNLKPETGHSKVLGVAYSSKERPGLEMSLTYFSIDIKNYIAQPATQDLIDNPSLFPGAVTRAPPSPQDVQNGFLGMITNVNETFYNYGVLSVAGLDADLSYRARTQFGHFTPSVAATETYRYDSALVPGSPTVSYVSQATAFGAGFAPRWKGTAALNWELDSYTAGIAGRFIGRYKDYQDFGPSAAELGNYWLFDANVRYTTGKTLGQDSKWLAGTYLQAGAVNLFNKLPQYSSFLGVGYDANEADIRGRFLYMQLGIRF